jgi:hypothetical protein
MVCKTKKKGGLGILNLKIKNEGLLLKYLHKFYNKEDTPWVHLLWNTYYTGKVPHTMAPCGSFWWRAVFYLSHIFRGITVSHVNDGHSTLFWRHKWLSNITSEEFLRAFSYTKNEDISVRDILTSNQLSLNFSLPLSPQALDEIRVLQGLAAHIDFSNDTHDTWTYEWGAANYTLSAYYNFCFRECTTHVSFLWVWKSKCTSKFKSFWWLVLVDQLNTRNMLRRRNYKINSSYNCLMCPSPPEETIEHMIFHCDFSRSCWNKLQMVWLQHGNRLEIIEQGRATWKNPLYMEITIVASWSIWKERNNKLFNGIDPSIDSWTRRFKQDFALLVHRTKKDLHPFINKLVDNL